MIYNKCLSVHSIFLKHDKFEREGETKNKLALRARSKKTTQRYRNATVDEVKSQTALQEWYSGLAFRAENLKKKITTYVFIRSENRLYSSKSSFTLGLVAECIRWHDTRR